MRLLKGIAFVLVFCLLAVGLTACKNSSSKMDDQMEVVRIGTQEMPNDEGIVKANKYLEKELGKRVEYIVFDSGGAVNHALASGSIDFGLIGTSPVSMAVANRIPIEVIWIHEVLGEVESLVVKEKSKISKISDLKGKKIAVPFASTAHYSLLSAFRLSGLSENDVTLYDMQPNDIYAAWKRNDIDAAYVWQPSLGELLKEDGRILLSSADMAKAGIMTANLEVVRSEFAEKYPEIVVKYIRAQEKAVRLYREAPQEAIDVIAKRLKIEPSDASVQMNGSQWLNIEEQLQGQYFGTSQNKGELVDALKMTADYLLQQNNVSASPSKDVFSTVVNPKYLEAAMKEQ